MRFAQFKLPHVKDDKVDAELVIFQNAGGGVRENLQRWKNQFIAPGGKSIDDVVKVKGMKIAREPCPVRDESRLLLMRRVPGGAPELAHDSFRDLPELLAPGDLLVLNDTRVVPARLLGRRARTGGRWEALFVSEAPGGDWEL